MGAFLDGTDKLSKTTGLIAANSDYTGLFWFRNKSTPAGGQYKAPLVFKNAGYTAYAAIYSNTAANTYRVFVDNGAGSASSTASITLLQDQWYPMAYVRSGNSHIFHCEGVVIGSATVNITAVTFAEELIGFDGSSINNFDIFGFREFNSALTLAQTTAELNSFSPVLTSYANTPLGSDALDTSGNGRNWTNTGVTFPYTSPIQVSLVNTSAPAAFELPEIPTGPASLLSGVQIVVDSSGVVNTVWFKTKSPNRDRVIDYMFYGRIGGGAYSVTNDAFYNSSNLSQLIVNTFTDHPNQLPIGNGSFYYFRCNRNSSSAANAVLAFDLFLAKELTVAAGSIFINSASEFDFQVTAGLAGLPGGIINPATGEIINFRPFFLCGEGGDVLPTSGRMLYVDEFGSFAPFPGGTNYNVYLFNPDFSQITSFIFDGSGGGGPKIRTHNESEKFYILSKGVGLTNTTFRSVDVNGNLGSLHTITSVGCTGFAVSADETILYLSGVGSSNNSNIKRWDIAGNAYLSDLSATVANYKITDMLVLSDGSIIACYFKTTVTRDMFVRRYNTSGTLLNTYTFTFPIALNLTNPRLGYAIDNPNSFFVAFNTISSDHKHNLRQVKVSDGTFINSSEVPNVFFSDPGAAETLTPTWPVVSDSCPIIQLRVGVAPPAVFGGIYIIVPGKTDDTVKSGAVTINLKIPDPTWRTAMLE